MWVGFFKCTEGGYAVVAILDEVAVGVGHDVECQFDPVGHSEFFKQVVAVGFDGLLADVQFAGNFSIGEAGTDVVENQGFFFRFYCTDCCG